MRVLSLCEQSRLPRRWENEFRWATGCKGNSFCSVTKRITWGAAIYITYGDNKMLESMITFLLLMIISFLLFSMMSGLES